MTMPVAVSGFSASVRTLVLVSLDTLAFVAMITIVAARDRARVRAGLPKTYRPTYPIVASAAVLMGLHFTTALTLFSEKDNDFWRLWLIILPMILSVHVLIRQRPSRWQPQDPPSPPS